MTITADNQDDLIAWAKDKIGGGVGFRQDAKAIGRMVDGHIRAVFVYDFFTSCDCWMHIASDGSSHWLTREFMREAFAYPFVQCDLRRVTGIIPASNEASLRFARRLGGKYEGRMRKALPNDDVIIMGILRSECVLIPKEFRHD